MARTFVKHAWFSKAHEALAGSLEMDTPDGMVVRITAVSEDKNYLYEWGDAVYLGVVLDGTFRNQSFKSEFNPPKHLWHSVMKKGDICKRCGEEVKDRMLFITSYVGCAC